VERGKKEIKVVVVVVVVDNNNKKRDNCEKDRDMQLLFCIVFKKFSQSQCCFKYFFVF
jgi:hypothetical protein